jgi:mannose-6-phosphate isomerase-like protein (cupin superfamily)
MGNATSPDTATGPKIVGPTDGKSGSLGSIGVRFMVDGGETGETFSLVEHPMPPRHLAAPMHRHTREDEYSFVLEGQMGAVLGDDTVFAGPGDLVHKPRNQWHTFWNAGDEPARILEIISPAGFEQYFAKLTEFGPDTPIEERLGLAGEYGLEVELESLPGLMAEHGLEFPMAPPF